MSKTILLADDSVTIRKVVELTFMDESFDLRSVGSGAEALEQFEAEVDLVIADIHMPGPNGYEVCQEIKKRSPGTPVLLLVGTFETFDERKAEESGADDHLKKPFDSQDLLSRVHNLLARRDSAADPARAQDDGGRVDEVVAEEPEPPFEAEGPATGGAVAGVAAGVTALSATEDLSQVSATTEAGLGAGVAEGTEVAGLAVEESGDEAEESVAEQAVVAAASGTSDTGTANVDLSDESVDRIARRVVELLSEDALREVAWEVIPDLAEVVIKERLNELESQVE